MANDAAFPVKPKFRPVRTPVILQMEAVECGAAALSIILSHFGRNLSLERLRQDCGVSRDGSKASNILKAARKHGCVCAGWRKEPADLLALKPPYIVFWNMNHFVVVEGFRKGRVYLSDPASGRRSVTWDEFDDLYSGVVLTIDKGPEFRTGGQHPSVWNALVSRLEGNRISLLFLFIASLLLVLPGLLFPVYTRIFLDGILVGGHTTWLKPLLWAMGLTGAAAALLSTLHTVVLQRLAMKLSVTGSAKFFWHILRLPMDFYAQRFGGEIGARVSYNDTLAGIVAGQLTGSALNLILIVFYGVVLFQYDVLLTAFGVSMVIVQLIAIRWITGRRIEHSQKLAQFHGKLIGTSMTGIQSIESIKCVAGESDFFAKWAGHHAKLLNAQQELARSSVAVSAIPTVLNQLNGAVMICLGGIRVMDGALTLGSLTAYQALMGSFTAPVAALLGMTSQAQELKGAVTRLDDVMRNPIDPRLEPAAAIPVPPAAARLEGQVDVRNLTFGYNRLDPPLIQNFDLTIRPGQRVALVGGSGSGKSTVARLIAGLLEPWDGEILFDGVLRAQLPRQLLTNSIAMVDQEIVLFEGTMRDNIVMWDRTVPDAAVLRAAKDAVIHETIAGLRDGYDYRVEEGARNFSGGQRQRIEIARALCGDPRLLVLDEATSALDPVTEKQVDANLRRRGCSCIVVAHRLSAIRDCDEIVVMERGRIVQRGTHAEMIRDEASPYARLVASD